MREYIIIYFKSGKRGIAVIPAQRKEKAIDSFVKQYGEEAEIRLVGLNLEVDCY